MIAFLTALALLFPQPAIPTAAAAVAHRPAAASAMRWYPGAPKVFESRPRPAAAMRWYPGAPKFFRSRR